MRSEADQLQVFFFPFMAQGHTIPMIDIARLFATRGIKSTVIATPLNALHFLESIDRDKQSGLDVRVLIIPFPAVEAGLPEGCENLSSITSPEMFPNFFKAQDMLQEPLERLLEEHRPDCIVSDMFFPWTLDVANKYGIPRLVFHGTSNFAFSVSENIHRYVPHEKVSSDSEIFVVPGLPDKIEMTRTQLPNGDHGGSERNKPLLDRLVKMKEVEVKSYGVLVNSFYELEPSYAEYYTKDMGRRAWNIGPVSLFNRNIEDKLHRGKKDCIDLHNCLSWLDSKDANSVLYVSFGSICRFGTAQLLEIAMGLEASGVSFIWVVRIDKNIEKEKFLPEGFEERMEGKGLIIRDWAPQVLILDHPAVGAFMTHCGWNSTLEGISAGVPLITWPMFAEQFNNEKLVTQVLKIGIPAGNEVWKTWIEPKDVYVTNQRVKEVVTRLMGAGEETENMRRRAKALGETARRAVEQDFITSWDSNLQHPESQVDVDSISSDYMELRSKIQKRSASTPEKSAKSRVPEKSSDLDRATST